MNLLYFVVKKRFIAILLLCNYVPRSSNMPMPKITKNAIDRFISTINFFIHVQVL